MLMASAVMRDIPVKLTQAEINRLSVPRITCHVCGITTTRSNLTDDMCDPCYDASPMHVFSSGHGVPWHLNSNGVPN